MCPRNSDHGLTLGVVMIDVKRRLTPSWTVTDNPTPFAVNDPITPPVTDWLSGEAPWVAVAPIDDGPMESDFVPHVVEDPVALLCPVMCASSGVTNICGILRD